MTANSEAQTGQVVGKTADVGFQIGVRRTLPTSPERIWAFLTSSEGLALWLGQRSEPLTIGVGESFVSSQGLTGKFTVVKPALQVRLKWQKNGWPKPSTLQIRLLSDRPDQTTVAFHQEHLDSAETRESMKRIWEDVLQAIAHNVS
ncbi:SRPBCC family protein [Paenibacillus whitsoniae]|uniref:SRPBCC domain-containing protein n=1 Tax=Paenibacillus whitsoniae TaxID=2496558 RepID=A0A430J528_9BACL|nr:SRPBCC domain-containing protein [Paenibacillus whitsoniae]RTE02573.1 SRPBCC domain-containing protein [Paenibacillus whitsoniae]